MPCINEKKCHENCTHCEEFETMNKAIDSYINDLYETKAYSCGGYMCTVATTCYEPEEQKKICTGCLKSRFLERGIE